MFNLGSRPRKAKILTTPVRSAVPTRQEYIKYFEDKNLSLTQGLGKRGRFSKVSKCIAQFHHYFDFPVK
jgi:hypothetical protein